MIRHRTEERDYVSFGLKEWAGLAIAALSQTVTLLGVGFAFYGEFSAMKNEITNIKTQMQSLTASERITVKHDEAISNIVERLRGIEGKK